MKKFVVLLPDDLFEEANRMIEESTLFDCQSQYMRWLIREDMKRREGKNETQ